MEAVEYDRMVLDVRELVMVHLARQALSSSNYISAQDLSSDIFAMLEKYGIKRGNF
jgi:hypothetical protein